MSEFEKIPPTSSASATTSTAAAPTASVTDTFLEQVAQEDRSETPVAEAPEFTEEELNLVFDQILFEGEYTEEQSIKGKLKFKLRSRTTAESIQVSRGIDKGGFYLTQTVEQYRGINNLSYSLMSYGSKDLSKLNVDERLAFIEKLPIFVVAQLVTTLSKFDRKVAMACQEAPENFSASLGQGIE